MVYITFQGTTDLREDCVIPKVRLIARRATRGAAIPTCTSSCSRRSGWTACPPSCRCRSGSWNIGAGAGSGLASADPNELPVVAPALLEHADDRAAMLGGFRLVQALVARPSLAALYGPLLSPADGEDQLEHILASYISYYHGVGTCRIGPADDPGAVVGPDLRVHGLDDLWVADASVCRPCPTPTRTWRPSWSGRSLPGTSRPRRSRSADVAA